VSEPRQSLRRLTLTGMGWTGGFRVVQIALQFVFAAVLARLLVPRDFGLIAALAVFTGFGIIFTDLGISPAIVQRQVVEERHLSSAFWLNLAMGVALTLVTMALAPALAAFYNEPPLVALTLVSAPALLLSSLSAVQNAILDRQMDFRKLSLIETTAQLTGNVVAIVMALTGFGVWSLVALALVQPGLRAALLWFSVTWRPRLRPERAALRELWEYGGGYTYSRALTYWAGNADNLLIGRFVGVNPLAFYNRAYNLMVLPNATIGAVTSRVMIPALSRLQHEKERVRRIYLDSIGLITVLMFPLVLGLLVLSHPFILAIYGPKWAPVAPLLQILCVVSFIQVITGTANWIFMTQGRTDLLFRWGIVSSITAIISFVIGLPWGVTGVAVAYTCWNVLMAYPLMTYAGRIIDLPAAEVGRTIAGVGVAALVMGGGVWAIEAAVPAGWGPWAQLATGIVAGAVIYFVALQILLPQPYLELKRLAADYRKLRSTRASRAAVASPDANGDPTHETTVPLDPPPDSAERNLSEEELPKTGL
jgi:O-antigen/teichoic acid export membrane protein